MSGCLPQNTDDGNIDKRHIQHEESSTKETHNFNPVTRLLVSEPVCGAKEEEEDIPTPSDDQRAGGDDSTSLVRAAGAASWGREGLMCYQPRHLPLHLSPSTRVTFAYELTRVAFCIDASPTLTSTFGNWGGSGYGKADEGDDFGGVAYCCVMDRLKAMVRTYFAALVDPISPAPIGMMVPQNRGSLSWQLL